VPALTADQLEDAARAAEAEAEQHERKAVALREHARLLREAKAGLTIAADAGTIETQMHVESAGAKRSAGQFTAEQLKHPFVAMLVKKKVSVADVAKFLEAELKREVPRSTVQAWYKAEKDASYRAIPEDAARAIRDKYHVPLSAWARVRSAK
jgi:hypothetical protein